MGAPSLFPTPLSHQSQRQQPESHVRGPAASPAFVADYPVKERLPPAPPGDNYAISDHASDCDESEARARREKKHVPAWCNSYPEMLAAQVDLDADSIFGCRVPRCNLEHIFPDALYKLHGKKRPKRRRGSSGDWHKDRLTHTEVTAYKDRMGQARTWSME